MKLELLFILFVLLVVSYDSYIKGPLNIAFAYGKTIIGIVICVYLMYAYYKSPEEFRDALDFLRGFFLNKGDFLSKQIDKFTPVKPGRNVSQLQKKKVAASQEWRCGHCRSILDASYEVDHIVALYKGGTNDENNLIALCRNCHGKKTVNERLNA